MHEMLYRFVAHKNWLGGRERNMGNEIAGATVKRESTPEQQRMEAVDWRCESDAQQIIHRLGIAALSRLEALSSSDDERIALAATTEILNRAFGKASVPTPKTERPAEGAPIVQVINYADWLDQQTEQRNA